MHGVALLEALGLGPTIDLDGLLGGRTSYDRIHLGMSSLPIGVLLDHLRTDGAPIPPRTGHIGNWHEIVRGRAGALDFNHAICAGGHGYALIYSFTQTEADEPRAGDWVYLPGSIMSRGARRPLTLFTWNGRKFAWRSRQRPLFTPLVLTDIDGELMSLTQVHWQRMVGLAGYDCRQEAEVILDHEPAVREMLASLIARAVRASAPTRALRQLVSHSVALDGTVERSQLACDGRGFLIDGERFDSVAALVEATLAPFRLVADQEALPSEIRSLPARLPILSHLVVGALSAVLATHHPTATDPTPLTRPVNVHMHWGARAMAGYPPRHRGYLVQKSTTRALRQIIGTLVTGGLDVSPVCFVLLPASVFMLCPCSGHPRDVELLTELFATVGSASADDRSEGDLLAARVKATTAAWLDRRRRELSRYFLSRFGPGRGLLDVRDVPESATPIEPAGFRSLSFRQGCMIVGAIEELVGAAP